MSPSTFHTPPHHSIGILRSLASQGPVTKDPLAFGQRRLPVPGEGLEVLGTLGRGAILTEDFYASGIVGGYDYITVGMFRACDPGRVVGCVECEFWGGWAGGGFGCRIDERYWRGVT